MPKKTDNPVAQLLTTQSLDTSRVDGGTEDGLVPVTYYPVLMQQQFIRNRAEVKDKPYSGFWNPDLLWRQATQSCSSKVSCRRNRR